MATVALIQAPIANLDYPSLGLGYIESFLKDAGHNTILEDFNLKFYLSKDGRLLWHRLKDLISFYIYDRAKYIDFIVTLLDLQSTGREGTVPAQRSREIIDDIINVPYFREVDVFGFTVSDYNSLLSLYIAKKLKHSFDKPIVFGGPECELFRRGNDFLDSGFVDYLVVGDGETAMKSLVNSLDEAAKRKINELPVPGTVIRGHPPDDLNETPFPDFISARRHGYLSGVIPLTTSRGCRRRCAFCDNYLRESPFLKRSPENVIEEIKTQKVKYNTSRFLFNDAMIDWDLSFLEKLCDLIISNRLEITWESRASLNGGFTPRLLDKMAVSGCKQLRFGLESASPKVLKLMNKKMTHMPDILKRVYEAGIAVHTCWIVGFPGEELTDFSKTLEFITKSAHMIDSASFTPLLLKDYTRLRQSAGQSNFTRVPDEEDSRLPNPWKNCFLWRCKESNWEIEKEGNTVSERRGRCIVAQMLYTYCKHRADFSSTCPPTGPLVLANLFCDAPNSAILNASNKFCYI